MAGVVRKRVVSRGLAGTQQGEAGKVWYGQAR